MSAEPGRPSLSTANRTRVRRPPAPSGAPGTSSTTTWRFEVPPTPRELPAHHGGLQRSLDGQVDVLPVAAPATPGTGMRARRVNPVGRARALSSTASARRLPAGLTGDLDFYQLARERVPDDTPLPSGARATQPPPLAIAPTRSSMTGQPPIAHDREVMSGRGRVWVGRSGLVGVPGGGADSGAFVGEAEVGGGEQGPEGEALGRGHGGHRAARGRPRPPAAPARPRPRARRGPPPAARCRGSRCPRSPPPGRRVEGAGDPAAAAVVLRLLADAERLQRPAPGGRHRRR